MFLSKLFAFCGGSRARFARASRRDTWRRGFRPQKCAKSVQNVVSSRRKWVGGGRLSPVLCFPIFGARFGQFSLENAAQNCFPFPPVLFRSVFCVFFRKNVIFDRGLLWYSYSALSGALFFSISCFFPKKCDFRSGFAVVPVFGGVLSREIRQSGLIWADLA